MVLLSGDVHLGQFYEAECASFTGQAILPEVTSSGLSHKLDDNFPGARYIMHMIAREDAVASPIYMGLNYGHIKIDLESQSKDLVHISIRDINGQEVLSKDYSRSDLAYQESNLTEKNSAFC